MGDTTLAEAYFDEAERLVLERDPLALDVVRLHRCFLDVARGDHDDAARRLAAAQTPRSDGVSLVEINDDARIVLRMLARHFSDGARPRLAVGPDALWFEAPGVGRQSLEKYTAARRILDCLVGARLERPGEGVSGEALFEAGWPAVSIAAQSANNRLYVALAKLRKVGLKVILLRQDDGYLLDPGTLVERRAQ
jgi:hypothetical protein